jgi:hypothetical protein
MAVSGPSPRRKPRRGCGHWPTATTAIVPRVTDTSRRARRPWPRSQRAGGGDKNRWNLARSNLDRAGHSADIIRGLLFSAAAASIGFIAYDKYGADLRTHAVPLLLLSVGVALTYISWDIQKGKSIQRFEALRDGNFDYDKTSYVPNYILDRIAAGTIAAGAGIEIAIRMCA